VGGDVDGGVEMKIGRQSFSFSSWIIQADIVNLNATWGHCKVRADRANGFLGLLGWREGKVTLPLPLPFD